MYEVQRFALEKINCSPSQDKQFNFKLVLLNKKDVYFKKYFKIYGLIKPLPNDTSEFVVFILGNINPKLLNLLRQKRDWFKDEWVKVSDDMIKRDYILKMYDKNGVIFPRHYTYYTFLNEQVLLIALELNYILKQKFKPFEMRFLHLYSNSYFSSDEFRFSNQKLIGIDYLFRYVTNNTEKAQIQNWILDKEQYGGKCLAYVNGYYIDEIKLTIPDNSIIEVIYDQSILSKEYFAINKLRTFHSILDNKMKYLIFRDKIINRIQYFDDNEIYITTSDKNPNKGIYFYQHKDYAIRNTTDKDYSLYTTYVLNSANYLSSVEGGVGTDKRIILFTRYSGLSRELIYSSMKLHEFYKLPQNVEFDVINNTNYTIEDFRAETLENSDYFKLARISNISNITNELATNVLGYNGICYYFGNHILKLDIPNVRRNVTVEELYRKHSLVYEYNSNGVMVGHYTSTGPAYIVNNNNVKFLEFIYGYIPKNFGRFYDYNETFTLRHNEFVILSAYYVDANRVTKWENITNDPNKVIITGNQVALNETEGKKIKVVYLNEVNSYDLKLKLSNGVFYFPLQIYEDRGYGLAKYNCEIPYTNIEIFLNGYRLTMGLDYFIDFPYVSICTKDYFDYTKDEQDIHIRMYGFTLEPKEINQLEVNGFVNNGVLTRNNYYDIREDRLFSLFIKGKMYDKSKITFAEEDNTVRIAHPLNGLPYTLSEPFVSIKEVSGMDTLPFYKENKEKNKRISNLFNIIFPEPDIDEFNIIADHNYLFSPTLSKIITDIKTNVIPKNLYTTPYDETTIIKLLDTEPYKSLMKLDPVRNGLPFDNELVVIHPHLGNTTVELELHQYRFVLNVIRIITNNKPEKIVTSGYLNVTTETQ